MFGSHRTVGSYLAGRVQTIHHSILSSSDRLALASSSILNPRPTSAEASPRASLVKKKTPPEAEDLRSQASADGPGHRYGKVSAKVLGGSSRRRISISSEISNAIPFLPQSFRTHHGLVPNFRQKDHAGLALPILRSSRRPTLARLLPHVRGWYLRVFFSTKTTRQGQNWVKLRPMSQAGTMTMWCCLSIDVDHTCVDACENET